MKQFVTSDVVEIFKQFYKFVDDVDLFLAGVAEIKNEGNIVGPTLQCLLALQFRDMKYGDRFWYKTNQAPAKFLPGLY